MRRESKDGWSEKEGREERGTMKRERKRERKDRGMKGQRDERTEGGNQTGDFTFSCKESD